MNKVDSTPKFRGSTNDVDEMQRFILSYRDTFGLEEMNITGLSKAHLQILVYCLENDVELSNFSLLLGERR